MTKKLSLALMIGAVLSASNAFGLGVGDIKVNSALNQRLNAEIELLSSVEGELDDVSVKLASLDAFDKLKLNRPYFLTGIQFKVTTRADGTPIVKLTTKDSIREPFLDFLVEVNWPKGKMLREYTILLDPPVTMASQAPAPSVKKAPAEVIVGEAPAPEPTPTPADEMPMVSAPTTSASSTYDTGRVDELGFPIYGDTPAASTAGAPATVSYSGEEYGPVAADETLWSIATKVRPESVTNQQMMLALFESNPEAFVNGDIHQVRRGAVLRIPDESAMHSRDQGDALAEVRQLNASMPAAGEITAEATQEQPGISERATEIVATDPMPARGPDESKLSIMAPEDAASSTAATSSAQLNTLKRELALANESLSSQQAENQELRSRVSELEGTVAEMSELKRLLELQNQEMAQLQQQLAQASQAEVTQPATEAAVPAPVEAAPEPIEAAPEPIEAAPEPVEEPTDIGTGTDVTTVAVEEPAPAPAPALPPPAKKDPMQIAMDYVNKVKDDPTLLGIAAAVLLVLIALIVLVFRRKGGGKAPAEAAAPAPDTGVTVEKAPAFAVLKDKLSGVFKKKDKAEEEDLLPGLDDEMFEEAGETEVKGAVAEAAAPEMEATADQTILEAPPDAGAAEAVAEMDFESDSGAAEAMTEEPAAEPAGPDPLEEVDVYEAFGDYEQAAEIVKQALSNDPDNNDFKLRLFNVYNGGGMADEFSTAAVQYEASMQGSSQWDQIVEMGKTFVPDCPAWAEEGAAGAAAPASEAGDMAATMAIDPSAFPSQPAAETQSESPTDMGMDFDLGSEFETTTAETAADAGAGDQAGDVMEFEGMGETAVLDVQSTESAAESVAEPEAGSADSNEMEFDLGGMEFESADEPAAEETVAEAASPEPAGNELEFDLGDFETGATEEPTASAEAMGDGGGLEFEMGEDSISATSDAVSETVQVNIDTDSGLMMDEAPSEDPTVMLNDDQLGSAEEDVEDADVDAADISMGIDLSDFEFDMDESGTSDAIITEEEKQAASASDDLGLGDLSLEAESEEPAGEELSLDAVEEPSEDPTVFLADDSDSSGGSLSEDGDEVSTKLDLARAYIDMGDSDGAKGILDEVMAEGNDQQKAEAESLLQQVG